VRARDLIRPKPGILDPQGQTVERALPALGFEGVSHVHVGRLVELDIGDPSQLDSMCEQLLTNPLIEDYEIQTVGEDLDRPDAGRLSQNAGLDALRR
jgi:phosphoribosylformylglycinamidine synthase PurS subunit